MQIQMAEVDRNTLSRIVLASRHGHLVWFRGNSRGSDRNRFSIRSQVQRLTVAVSSPCRCFLPLPLMTSRFEQEPTTEHSQ